MIGRRSDGSGEGQSWDAFPTEKPTDYAGMAKQGGVGLAKGAVGLVGLGGDIQQLAQKSVDYVKGKLPDIHWPEPSEEGKRNAERYGSSGDLGPSFPLPTSSDIQGAIEKFTGAWRKPQNQAEADAETVGEFVPAALAGPGGVARKAVAQVAAPAAASIVAGRLTDQNPYVKALAGFVAGGAGALASGPGSAESVIRSKIPASVTEGDITRAGQLIEHANTRGVTLTWPEALSRITGQPILTDTQRILESHGQTRGAMNDIMSQRPAQIEQAARNEFDQALGPASAAPSSLGPEAGRVFEKTVGDIEKARTRAVEPYYNAAKSEHVPSEEVQQLVNNIDSAIASDKTGIVGNSLKEIRRLLVSKPAQAATPATRVGRETPNGMIYDVTPGKPAVPETHLTDIENLDRVRKYVRDKMDLPQIGQDAITKEQGKSIIGAIDELKSRMLASSENFATGKQLYEDITKKYVQPIMDGPIGKLADRDVTTKNVISRLFEPNPLPGSEREIRDAVSVLAKNRPAVAEQIVRAHAEMVFNEAARDLQGGANQFAGAKFSKVIAGNSQQRANLKAAVESLPNGKERWQGFEHLLDIMSATGTRQARGSLTAFNELEIQSMSNSGLMSLAAKGASPGKWMSLANDTFKSWSLGRNLDRIAGILTDPRSGDALKQIVRIPAGSDRAVIAAGKIIAQASAATTNQRTKQDQ